MTEYEATYSTNNFLAKKKQISSTATVEMVKMNWIRISFQSIVGGPSLMGVGRGEFTQQSLNRNFALRLNPLPFWTILTKRHFFRIPFVFKWYSLQMPC